MPLCGGFSLAGWSHGLLYCVASLVLGIELNIVGPTVNSLAAQVGVAEAALGGVVGLGGIGLLVGGLPSGWLLDRLPGHTVMSGALALQAIAFILLPHCAHLAVLAAAYCAAALTFNAITTGANALILWRYPASQGAWLNLASALFGVGCFLAPVLADLASSGGGGGPSPPNNPPEGDQAGSGGGSGGNGGPFSLRGGPAAMAYYAVAAGAAACCLWAALLPSPSRPDPHHHHHHHDQDDGTAVEAQQSTGPSRKLAGRARSSGSGRSSHSSGGGGSSPGAMLRSPSFASVLDMGGLESPTASNNGHCLPTADGADAAAAPPPMAAAAEAAQGSFGGGAAWGTSSTASPNDAAASAAASPKAPPPSAAAPAKLPPPPPSLPLTSNGGGGSGSGTDGGFGSALSTSPSTWDEAGAGAPDQDPVYGAGAAAAPSGGPDPASNILCAAAAQIKLLQRQQHHKHEQNDQQQQHAEAKAAAGLWQRGGAAAAGTAADGELGRAAPQHPSTAAAGAAAASRPPPSRPATAALFRRYLHELRMGWPVLLPVVLLLFANISTQASFGAWVTTYCQRAAGLDEAAAHAVTAAYWAAFTGTRMAAVAAAPFLHASRVLLITSPFAVAGAGMAVLGLPKIPWLLPVASATAAAAASPTAAFAAGLPLWALYTAVCLVGVGVSTGFANTVSLTGDHLQLDGFTNGILSSVAGLASTLCPAAVPWLAQHTGMGYGALMAVALAMSCVQLAMVLAALLGARWVDEWAKLEEAAEEEAERREEEEERRKGGRRGGEGGRGGVTVVVVMEAEGEGGRRAAAAAKGRRADQGDLTAPLLQGPSGGDE